MYNRINESIDARHQHVVQLPTHVVHFQNVLDKHNLVIFTRILSNTYDRDRRKQFGRAMSLRDKAEMHYVIQFLNTIGHLSEK